MNDTIYSSVESVVTENGQTLLGINLSVLPGKLLATGPQAVTIQPWLWHITGWELVVKKAASGTWVAQGTKTHLPVPDVSTPWQPLVETVKTLIGQAALSMQAAGGSGLPPTPTQKIVIEQDFAKTPAAQLYHAMLMNLSAAPYPVAQTLNLSFFLEFPSITDASAYVALPVFSISGAKWDPAFTAISADGTWTTTVTPSATTTGAPLPAGAVALDMHSEFVSLAWTTAGDCNSLWLDNKTNANTLVANWPAHLPDLITPYLDTANVMASVPDNLSPDTDTGTDWPAIRESFRRALYDLFDPIGLPAYESNNWAAKLVKALPQELHTLAAVDPLSAPVRMPVADLRALLVGITAGPAQLALLTSIYGSNLPVPGNLLDPAKATALTWHFQTGQAATQTLQVAQAVASVKTTLMADVAAALLAAPDGPIYANLKSKCPEWLNLFAAFVSGPLKDRLTQDLNRLAYGTDAPGGVVTTMEAAPMILPIMPLATDPSVGAPAKSGDPLFGMRGVGVLLRHKADPSAGRTGPWHPRRTWPGAR